MDVNLILTAQTLVLAPHVRASAPICGMLVLKNIPAKTYLHVTQAQWVLLQQFRQPRTVPSVLGYALEERLCLPLSEFFELVLKAVRANILLEPHATTSEVKSVSWRVGVRAQAVAKPLIVLFVTGLIVTLSFRPELPSDYVDVLAGLAVLSLALSVGTCLAACMLRGSGGEVYRAPLFRLLLPPHFDLDRTDSLMLPLAAQRAAIIARAAMLATATGLLAWHQPAWNLLPLIALAITLRPILGGRIPSLFRLGRGRGFSDAELAFIFPPNLRPSARWRLLKKVLSHPETWVKIVYGVVWSLAFIYLAGQLTQLPPWKIEFWKVHGIQVATGAGGALVALVVGLVGWHMLQFLQTRARHRRQEFRLSWARWFAGKKIVLDEETRLLRASASALFRTLPPADRRAFVASMEPAHCRARAWLEEYSGSPTHAALIVSGKIGLYRVLPSGRNNRVQVLTEGDVVGLHDLADPEYRDYRVRALTPLTLLKVNRATMEQSVTDKITPATLTNLVLKLPFLRSITLCRNWHSQAIERFAQLSVITNWISDGVIVHKGNMSHYFFVIFENNAVVTQNKSRVAVINAGEFFGEIGLLQNSSAVADISARRGTRCLSISRTDFLRFVTHNHLVALELERVSSIRLGGPIFPLKAGNFRVT